MDLSGLDFTGAKIDFSFAGTFEESVADKSSRVKSTWDQFKDQEFNKLIADIYQHRSPSKMVYNAEPLIPKIMHQIWIGSSSLPPLYEKLPGRM